MLLQVVFAVLFQVVYGHLNGHEKNFLKKECYDGVCWKDRQYPAELIMDRLMSNDVSNINTFGRFGESNVAEHPERSCNLCETAISLRVTPLVKFDDGKKYYVVNTEKYLQNITINICKDSQYQDQSLCKQKQGSLQNDVMTSCEQKFTTIRLLCYDEESDLFVGKAQRYPSSCVCTLKKLLS